MYRKTNPFRGIVILMLLFGLTVNGYSKKQKRSAIVEVTGYSFFSEDMSIKDIRRDAMKNAKREALERGDAYIHSITQVKNMVLEYDLIEIESEGLIRILDSKDLGFTDDNRYAYWIRAELKYVLKLPDGTQVLLLDDEPVKTMSHADSEEDTSAPEKEAEKEAKKTDQPAALTEQPPDTATVLEASESQQESSAEDSVSPLIGSNPAAPLPVTLWTDKTAYHEGEEVKIFLKGNKDFYGRIVYIDVSNKLIQLLPNLYRESNLFKGNKIYNFPGEGDKFNLKIRPPLGREKIVVYASTSPLGDIQVKPLQNDLLAIQQTEEETSVLSRSIAIHAWGKSEESEMLQPEEIRSEKVRHEAEFFESECLILTEE